MSDVPPARDDGRVEGIGQARAPPEKRHRVTQQRAVYRGPAGEPARRWVGARRLLLGQQPCLQVDGRRVRVHRSERARHTGRGVERFPCRMARESQPGAARIERHRAATLQGARFRRTKRPGGTAAVVRAGYGPDRRRQLRRQRLLGQGTVRAASVFS